MIPLGNIELGSLESSGKKLKLNFGLTSVSIQCTKESHRFQSVCVIDDLHLFPNNKFWSLFLSKTQYTSQEHIISH